MESLIFVISWGLILFGCFFYVVGAIGLIRMPDFFTRMHGVSLSDTAGVICFIVAMMLQAGWGLISAKLFFTLVILLYSGPVVSHALARAAFFAGLRPELDEDRTDGRFTPSREEEG